MGIDRRRATRPVFDMVCVLALVVIGTRNHDTDTGLAGVVFVGAPFWLAAIGAHLTPTVRQAPDSLRCGVLVWVTTVALGMVLRRFVFDRGTALAFVIVASVFLGVTMVGWRAITTRTSQA